MIAIYALILFFVLNRAQFAVLFSAENNLKEKKNPHQ